MPRGITSDQRMPQRTPGQRTAPGRALGAVLVALGLIATTSCSRPAEPVSVENPVRLLQSVRVGLSPAAGVETIEGTTISVSAAGNSSAKNTTFDAAQVVGELPVRVSLQYRAGQKSGSDLSELQGHSGPVEIDLTLENLTVKPRLIEYDAAGQTRSDAALVGAPLTIAASTKLTGVRAGDVTPGSADGGTGTNGVLSRTEDGATVVQWATVLAPPRSGASTTLRLVADVQDFQVPAFDVAIQPGLNTDLSTDGVLAGAFSSGPGSEMELQRRTISLVSDVNAVLAKAGSTITEVRRNLQVTSQTLGAKTAGELRDNSTALAATMVDLKEQLKTLGADLETATTTTQSTTAAQLKQTVSAVDAMLGDTSAVPPAAPIDGEGCTADVPKSAKAATVYSSVLTMASQLDAYAKVSTGCRDIVAGAIRATMGPEEPTAEECAAQGSMTCSLYGSAVTVTGALLGLVQKGDALVADLQPQVVEAAIRIAVFPPPRWSRRTPTSLKSSATRHHRGLQDGPRRRGQGNQGRAGFRRRGPRRVRGGPHQDRRPAGEAGRRRENREGCQERAGRCGAVERLHDAAEPAARRRTVQAGRRRPPTPGQAVRQGCRTPALVSDGRSVRVHR